MDYVVFGYVAAICALTAVLFGLAPALHVSKTNNNEVLKEGARGTTGNRRARWLSGTMVVTELALTVVLLAGSGLMVRSFMNLQRLDLGFPTDHLVTMRMGPGVQRDGRRAWLRDGHHQRADGVAVVPGGGPDRQAAQVRGSRACAGSASARVADDRRRQPVDSPQRDEAGRAHLGHLPSAPPGAPVGGVAAHPQPPSAELARGLGAAAGAGDRFRPAGLALSR